MVNRLSQRNRRDIGDANVQTSVQTFVQTKAYNLTMVRADMRQACRSCGDSCAGGERGRCDPKRIPTTDPKGWLTGRMNQRAVALDSFNSHAANGGVGWPNRVT